jgi:hypothetical protein
LSIYIIVGTNWTQCQPVLTPDIEPIVEPVLIVSLSSKGSSFVVVASPSNTHADHVRVLAGDKEVKVNFANGSTADLKKVGDFLEISLLPDQSVAFSANKPIQVSKHCDDDDVRGCCCCCCCCCC